MRIADPWRVQYALLIIAVQDLPAPLGTDAVSKFLEEASFSLTMDVSEDVGGVTVGDYADLAGRQRSPIFSSSCNRSLYG
jgi:hypothetical protein